MQAILRQLRRAALLSVGDGLSDAQLLESFLTDRDEAAFEALVRRHGPMVLAVCRRVTGNAHDAEDAFQATFLVLARKAVSLRSRQVLPGWLYQVAYRTALNTRTMTKKRRAKEQQAALQPRPEPADDGVPEELLARLDEVLNRLPDRYRLPVVLCELQGRSRKEAAQLLGLPVGTVSWRLAHARKLLAQRLARYGTMISAGALAAAFSQGAVSAVPVSLVRAVTVQALVSAAVPAPIQALTEGVLKAMLLSKLKFVWGATLAFVVGAGAVVMVYRPAVAADPHQSGPGAAARANQDELDEMRLEIAALRKGLQATRERVKTLEEQVTMLQGRDRGGFRAFGGPEGSGDTAEGGGRAGFERFGSAKGGGGFGGRRGRFGARGPTGKMGPADKEMQNQHGDFRRRGAAPDSGPVDRGPERPPTHGPTGSPGADQVPWNTPLPANRGGAAGTSQDSYHRPVDKGVGSQEAGATKNNREAQMRIYRTTLQRAADTLAVKRASDAATQDRSLVLKRAADALVTQHNMELRLRDQTRALQTALAKAQSAAKQLREHPDDKEAADRLDRAFKQLQSFLQDETKPKQ